MFFHIEIQEEKGYNKKETVKTEQEMQRSQMSWQGEARKN